jgi:hypothetical protein
MIPIIIAGVATLGMAGVVLFGVTRIFRRRKITMVDYPELPPPSSDDKGGTGGPTRQA